MLEKIILDGFLHLKVAGFRSSEVVFTLIEQEIGYKFSHISCKLYDWNFAFNKLTSQKNQLTKLFPLTHVYEWSSRHTT